MKLFLALLGLARWATCTDLEIVNHFPFFEESIVEPTPYIDTDETDAIAEDMFRSSLLDKYFVRGTDEAESDDVPPSIPDEVQQTLWESFSTKEKYQVASASFILIFGLLIAFTQLTGAV